MKIFLIIAAFAGAIFVPTVSFAAAEPACEDSLKALDAAIKKAAPKPDLMVKVKVLVDNATERCTSEDDKRSNGFAADAMKLLTP